MHIILLSPNCMSSAVWFLTVLNCPATPIPLLNDACSIRTDDEDEVRRKRFPTDRAYFIAKELLTTERTYLKDLEVMTVVRQAYISKPVCCLVSPTCLSTWGETHSLFWFGCSVAAQPPDHRDGH
ncbi:hypothetical protein AMECASPLE_034354 [Ameca splendens]|uniref:DH domain-containing protein n=1 Tax=Ameca splendens TaxID=208324 RepID=A0ABV0YI51_9TELE